MASTTGQASVTTAAAKVADGDTNAPAFVYLRNRGTVSVFWGYAVSGLTSSTGVELGAGEGISVPTDAGDIVACIAASGTQRVDWARTRSIVRGG